MDMLPPQAPPAYVNHANQAAIDSLDRLRQTQAWLLAQQDALPDMASGIEVPATFLADLDTFWESLVEHAPGEPPAPRRQVLALRLAQTARDDASLRSNDGTLDAEAVETISLFAQHHGDGLLPDHLHARELLVDGAPYTGSFVLENDRDPGRVLCFDIDAGWTAFASLDELYAEAALDIRNELNPDHSSGMQGIAVRSIDGDAFDVLARGLVARMRQRVVAEFDREGDEVSLQDRLHAAMDLSAVLDVHAIVRKRDLALAARMDDERLARQPARVRENWRQAASAYRDAWREGRDEFAVPSLAWYADAALSTALQGHGIDVPPHDLRVRLTRRVPEAPVSNLLSGFPYDDLPLVALAYRNIGQLQTEHLQVIREDGSARDDVPAETLREVVRDLDLPTRYSRHLDDTLGDSTEGLRRRASHHALQAARMRFEAADARLVYFDTGEPRSFQDDRLERGFHWVQAVLDAPHPATRRKVEGHEIVVHQLTYKGAPLAGVVMISARRREAVHRVVLYTPDAPDGIAFREFGDRSELTRQFILNPRFEGYLLDRLPLEFAAFDASTGKRQFVAPKLNDGRDWNWVFNLAECNPRDRCTQLAERFQEREVTGSFLDAQYDVAVHLAKRNAFDLARATARADWDSAFDVWGWNVPFNVAKEFVTGTLRSLPHAAQAGWRFYDSVKAGDGKGAFLAFVEGYTAGLSVLPLYTQVPAAIGSRMRAVPGSRTLVPTRRTLPAPDTLFESRFLARGVAVPSGNPPGSGVYTIGGNRYIHQGGGMYHVQFDSDIGGWRLRRPGALDARVSGPAIERLADGQWHFRRVGLLGGSGRGAPLVAMLEEVKDILDDTSRLNPEVAALSESQRVMLIAELRRNLRLGPFVTCLRERIDLRPPPFLVTTQAQREAWNAALDAARSTPAQARPLTLSEALGISEPTGAMPPVSSLHATPGRSTASVLADAVRSMPQSNVFDWPMGPWGVSARGLRLYLRHRDWPEFAYMYLPSGTLARQTGLGTITLPQMRHLGQPSGVPLTTLPPETPLSVVPRNAVPMMSFTAEAPANATLGSAFGEWIRIDMRRVSFRKSGRRRRFSLFRVPDTSERGFVLREVAESYANRYSSFGETPITLLGGEFDVSLPRPLSGQR